MILSHGTGKFASVWSTTIQLSKKLSSPGQLFGLTEVRRRVIPDHWKFCLDDHNRLAGPGHANSILDHVAFDVMVTGIERTFLFPPLTSVPGNLASQGLLSFGL